jgi:hypothetical protein
MGIFPICSVSYNFCTVISFLLNCLQTVVDHLTNHHGPQFEKHCVRTRGHSSKQNVTSGQQNVPYNSVAQITSTSKCEDDAIAQVQYNFIKVQATKTIPAFRVDKSVVDHYFSGKTVSADTL